LSTTDAELITLSGGLRSTIPLIGLLTEFHEKGVPMQLCMSKIHCRAFVITMGPSNWLKVSNIDHAPITQY